MIEEKLGAHNILGDVNAPRMTRSRLKKIEEEKKAGNDVATLGKSTICGTMAPTELGALRKKDGEEGLGK